MAKESRIPERSEITDDTPLDLKSAAALAFPDGSITAVDLARAIREGRVTCELTAGIAYLTLGYIRDMVPGPKIPAPSPGNGLVYVVGYGPYVKIGFTAKDVDKRIAELSTGSPEQIMIYAAIDAPHRVEMQLHRRFAAYRLRGEWFRRKGDLADWIDAGCPHG